MTDAKSPALGKSTFDVPQSVSTRATQSSAMAQLMIDSIHDYAVFMLDPTGNILTWNIGARRIMGYVEPEIIGCHFSCFYPEETRGHEPRLAIEAASRDRHYDNEGWLSRKDGRRFWASIVIEPVRGMEGGEDIGFAEVIRDTTERRMAEEALLQANQSLERRVEERTQELNALNEKLTRLADTDPLTGIFNRRGFVPLAKHELARSARYQTPLSVLFVDIDNFKMINDKFGHAAGDAALQTVVRQMGGHLRAGDVMARLGGDEFVLLLLETDRTRAARVAERLRQGLASVTTQSGDTTFTTLVSIGLAEWTVGEAFDGLLARADAELYAAKRARPCGEGENEDATVP